MCIYLIYEVVEEADPFRRQPFIAKTDSCESATKGCGYTEDFCARRNEFPQHSSRTRLNPITIAESLTREFKLRIISNVPL